MKEIINEFDADLFIKENNEICPKPKIHGSKYLTKSVKAQICFFVLFTQKNMNRISPDFPGNLSEKQMLYENNSRFFVCLYVGENT